MSEKKKIGMMAEDLACRYLLKQGLRLIRRNYACKMGEIDLVMLGQQCIVFVEVRYRKLSIFGNSLETIDRKKQQKLLKTAQYYLLLHPADRKKICRFDVVAMTRYRQKPMEIVWIKQAFTYESY